MTAEGPIRIDGSRMSGSGTIVRFSAAFAALLGRPLHLVNARARRPKPGLRAQHVAAVRACAEICGGRVSGVEVGAGEFTFEPGGPPRGGSFAWDIGTAGSTTMLALGILPLACLASGPTAARITGGVFQDFAPSPHHMARVLAPLLARMGAGLTVCVARAGYVPRGSGVLEITVSPAPQGLAALVQTAPGRLAEAAGIAFASHLGERQVSERMARACEKRLAAHGIAARLERVEDEEARHPGAGLAVWGTTSRGAVLGADRAGARNRSSEEIGRFVADSLAADLAAGATVDRHAADQLVPFAAVALGESRYVPPGLTEHLETNLWLASEFGARVRWEGAEVRIEGLGLPAAG